jgi:scyllo-inositol 2-dehydrogenase (NADP+)
MDRKPRIVVIGYGYAGRAFHTYLIGLTPDLELYGVSSRNPETRERIQRELGVKTYESFESVLADSHVDAVVLATPHDTHCPLAVQAAEAGKHVITDKVMALNLQEADRMIEAARSAGVLLTVFHNRRWDCDYLTVKQVWDSGLLGDIVHVETTWCQFGKPRGWRGEHAHGGGKFYDLGAHMIDQAVTLVAEPIESVSAHFHYAWPDRDIESHADCLIRFKSGMTWLVQAGSLDRDPKPRWHVVGTKRTLTKFGVDPQERAMNARNIDAAPEEVANRARLWGEWDGLKTETVVQTVPGRWRSFYENVADALLERAPLAITPESVRRGIAVIDAALRSAEKGGQTVPVNA